MSKHSKDTNITHNTAGDVVNMRGTITDASGPRPYAPKAEHQPKHAKRN